MPGSIHRRLRAGATALVALTFLLAGCSSGSTADSGKDATRQSGLDTLYAGTFTDPPSTAPAAQRGKKIWVIPCGQVAAACADAAQASVEAAKALGWHAQVCDGKLNPGVWAQCVRQGVAAGYDAILDVGLDCAAIQQPLQEAKDAGVPVVEIYAVDCDDPSVGGRALFAASVVPNSKATTTAAYDESVGKARAQWIAAVSDGKANIIEVNFEGAATGTMHHQGFANEIKACAGCTVTEAAVTNQSIGNLRQIVESALLKNPDADYLVVPLDSLTLLGTAAAVTASQQRTKLTVVGGEGAAPVMDLMRAKRGVDVLIGQSSGWWGYAGTDTILRTLAGEKPVPQGLGFQLVDRSSHLPSTGGYVPPIDYKSAYLKAWGVS